MAYVKEYWSDKNIRAKQAKLHTEEMQRKYINEILYSVNNTQIYRKDFRIEVSQRNETQTGIIVIDADTVEATSKWNEGKTAVLNFSSYKNAGGMFLNGSKAQEECLCHASFLYNVLASYTQAFYEWNNQHKNKALYLNRALYSPDIVFEYNESVFKCDVITCAAPNKSAAQKYQNVSDDENTKFLRERIKFVLKIAYDNNVETLMLGAYGCGVFGQNPTEVATIFKEYLSTDFNRCFKNVIFAIPKSSTNNNYTAFENVFNVGEVK